MWHKVKNTTEIKIYGIILTLGAKQKVYIVKVKGKGKVIPLQARCCPEGG